LSFEALKSGIGISFLVKKKKKLLDGIFFQHKEAFVEVKRVRPFLELGFDLRECCGWFDFLSKPLKLSPCQQQGFFGFLHVFARKTP
jgi:hypothetical protein